MTENPDSRRSFPAPDVDILMTVYDGVPYVEEQLRSLQAQTHTNWRLWIRDDGSTDETVAVLEDFAARDSRVHLLPSDGKRLGAIGGFSYLVENAPVTADYIFFCDADDVWLPTKIEAGLRAMMDAEAEAGGKAMPLLVHTDLAVVGKELEPIADSFWTYERIVPQPAKLNSLLVHNTVTGCAMMVNAALMRLVPSIPPAAIAHDWWFALTAVCFGRIVSVPEVQIRYRQHGRNDTGAKPYHTRPGRIPSRLMDLPGRSAAVQASIRRLAAQAQAFREVFDERLRPEQRELISSFVGIPESRAIVRKYRLLRLGTLGHGLQRQARFVLLG